MELVLTKLLHITLMVPSTEKIPLLITIVRQKCQSIFCNVDSHLSLLIMNHTSIICWLKSLNLFSQFGQFYRFSLLR